MCIKIAAQKSQPAVTAIKCAEHSYEEIAEFAANVWRMKSDIFVAYVRNKIGLITKLKPDYYIVKDGQSIKEILTEEAFLEKYEVK